jgi:hypothetical protein
MHQRNNQLLHLMQSFNQHHSHVIDPTPGSNVSEHASLSRAGITHFSPLLPKREVIGYTFVLRMHGY